jgi:hypothetical protein
VPVVPEFRVKKISSTGEVTLLWNTQMSDKIDISEQTFVEVRLLPGSDETDLQNLIINNFTMAFDESFTKMSM